MFQDVPQAAPDAILGLTEAFKADTNPDKINLGVGVYKDENGNTPILPSVKEAERRLIDDEKTKSYLPIDGDPQYDADVRKLLFGRDHELVSGGRAFTAQTPGGTGALRVAGDYIHLQHSGSTIWLSDPTWANHPAVYKSAEVPTKAYTYFDKSTNGVNFDGMLVDVKNMPAGDVILLHGCCHNPTGADLSDDQWQQLGELLAERGILPLVDFAYQGFAEGLREDAAGFAKLLGSCKEMIICSSFSKNFGLYNERTGAVTFVTDSEKVAKAVQSQVKTRIRTNYSNPPSHGGSIVRTILGDDALASQWEGELAEMRNRIAAMRQLFVDTLKEKGVKEDVSFITQQRGMFSFSGLSPQQVQQLKEKWSVYIVGSGRINVAGMTRSNMDRLCTAVADVM